MLNLSEQWKQAYAEYLTEQEENLFNDVDLVCKELNEAQAEVSRGYKLLEDYCRIILEKPEDEDEDGKKPEDDRNKKTASEGGNNTNFYFGGNGNSPSNRETSEVNNLIKELIKIGSDNDGKFDRANYEPAVTYTTQKITDMKFPQNIIFFLGQLVKWIRNIVIFFIEKFKNLLRRLVGVEPVKFEWKNLTMNLEKAKKVEQVSTSIDLGKGKDSVVKAWKIDPSKISSLNLTEGYGDKDQTFAQYLGIVKKEKDEPVKKDRVVVTVDLSRDIMNLKELMQHFYDLFDGAYGSNNEKLFATDDLEVILDIFKDTIEKVKTGDLNVYSIGGSAVEAPGISKDRVRENLVTTNTNINALKEAYMQTSAKIQDITKIINSKEMMMLSDMGVDFRLLTSSTYEQLKRIIDTMPARFREANKLEKDLTKIQKKYDKLVQELSSMQRMIASVSNVTYDTIASRRLIDLLSAANWMSQTITLRIAGLGLYIRELKDVRDAIVMLAKVNLGKGAEKKLYRF